MQNRSSAVMQQRIDPPDSLDFFPTLPFATRAFCEHVLPRLPDFSFDATAWDPGCGKNDMVRPLKEYFARAVGSDIFDYGVGAPLHDFRRGGCPFDPPIDWVVTNPPFKAGETFIYMGLRTARIGVAMLVRVAFVEGQGRYKRLYSKRPPDLVAQYAERVPLLKGRLDPDGSSATAYCWCVWLTEPLGQAGIGGSPLVWIPPSRARLERPGDYDGYSNWAPPASGDLFE